MTTETIRGGNMAQEVKTIEMQLPSRLGYEKVAMDAAGAAAKLIGFHHARIEDLRTAVAEACINAMEHAHKFNSAMKVIVALNLDEGQLQIDIADQGSGAESKAERPDIEKKFAGEQTSRGWGIFLIKALMDEVQFNVKSDRGNVTRMVIRLDPSDADDEPQVETAGE